jgi:hypothetical protein
MLMYREKYLFYKKKNNKIIFVNILKGDYSSSRALKFNCKTLGRLFQNNEYLNALSK